MQPCRGKITKYIQWLHPYLRVASLAEGCMRHCDIIRVGLQIGVIDLSGFEGEGVGAVHSCTRPRLIHHQVICSIPKVSLCRRVRYLSALGRFSKVPRTHLQVCLSCRLLLFCVRPCYSASSYRMMDSFGHDYGPVDPRSGVPRARVGHHQGPTAEGAVLQPMSVDPFAQHQPFPFPNNSFGEC